METQLKMKLQMNYLQKDDSAFLLKCWRVIDSSNIKFCTCDDSTPN